MKPLGFKKIKFSLDPNKNDGRRDINLERKMLKKAERNRTKIQTAKEAKGIGE